jgi:hypothetical protein
MSIQFSRVIASQAQGNGTFSVKAVKLDQLGKWTSPVLVLD